MHYDDFKVVIMHILITQNYKYVQGQYHQKHTMHQPLLMTTPSPTEYENESLISGGSQGSYCVTNLLEGYPRVVKQEAPPSPTQGVPPSPTAGGSRAAKLYSNLRRLQRDFGWLKLRLEIGGKSTCLSRVVYFVVKRWVSRLVC